jgi:hypothetical protein
LLFDYENELNEKFGIIDPNFSNNGRELIKIFTKKTYHNIKQFIENILHNERQNKGERSSDGLLITSGPANLFKLLYNSFDLVKRRKIKPLIESVLDFCKECIIHYLIGLDVVVDVSLLILYNRVLHLTSIKSSY